MAFDHLAQGLRLGRGGRSDLQYIRGTAVTRLALVEAWVPEIATITGHSLRDVAAIFDSNCLNREPALGESAIRKLEREQKLPTGRPTDTKCSNDETGKWL
ncbi:hypothetical protein NKI32_29185 [Mesorhizobium sp. M0761]|uniref:hypothetical protein n=1 Tax=unclassified Mesorhizobium TaxID=325217 RepID=UPI00333A9EB9